MYLEKLISLSLLQSTLFSSRKHHFIVSVPIPSLNSLSPYVINTLLEKIYATHINIPFYPGSFLTLTHGYSNLGTKMGECLALAASQMEASHLDTLIVYHLLIFITYLYAHHML